MFEKVCVPYAPTLIESMRSIGYSFPSAIADLLDNSVSVHAKHIDRYVIFQFRISQYLPL